MHQVTSRYDFHQSNAREIGAANASFLDGASNSKAKEEEEEEEEEALTWTLEHAKRQRVASVFVAGRKGTESR